MLWKGEKIAECWTWIGDVQKTDLKKSFDKKFQALNGEKVKPLYCPTEEGQAGQNGAGSGGMDVEGEAAFSSAPEIDLYDEVQPKKVFEKKFDEAWCEDTLQLQKWTEKVEQVEELLKAMSVPRVCGQKSFHIVSFAKRLLKDSNVQVALAGVKLVGQLSCKIRGDLGPVGKKIASCLLEKLKERKKKITDTVLTSLTQCFYVCTPDNIW